MCGGKFTAVVELARIGYKLSVVFEPRAYSTLLFAHLAVHQGHIAAVVNCVFPVLLKFQGDLLVFCEQQQTGGVTVQTVYGMRMTLLMIGFKILIQNALNCLFLSGWRVAKNAVPLLNYEQILIFVNYPYPWAFKRLAALVSADFYLHSGGKLEVVFADLLTIHAHRTGEYVFGLGTADAIHLLHDER